jgi:hypothetical protein
LAKFTSPILAFSVWGGECGRFLKELSNMMGQIFKFSSRDAEMQNKELCINEIEMS